MMDGLLYVSQATRPFSGPALSDLCLKAQQNNAELGLSGALVYLDGRFVQYIEGPPAEVARLYERVEEDDRHTIIRCIKREPQSERLFSNWSMQVLTQWSILGSGMRAMMFSPTLDYMASESLRTYERQLLGCWDRIAWITVKQLARVASGRTTKLGESRPDSVMAMPPQRDFQPAGRCADASPVRLRICDPDNANAEAPLKLLAVG
ncbi:MAG: BLUF domain-containing protein [Planctomycetota bacterium]